MFSESSAICAKLLGCRACQESENTKLISLFDQSFYLKFETCTNIKVLQSDPLPKVLCQKCYDLVNMFFDFIETCKRTQEVWEDVIKFNTNTIKLGQIPYSENKDHFTEKIENDMSDANYDHTEKHETNQMKTKKKAHSKQKKCIVNGPSRPRRQKLLLKGGRCGLCQKLFTYRASLIRHISICDGKKVWIPSQQDKNSALPLKEALFCGICETNLRDFEETCQHLKDHILSNDLTCKLCDYIGIDFADLFCHRFRHQGEIKPMLRCYECNKRFRGARRLEYHVRGEHLGRRPGLCRFCLKAFGDYKHWLLHEATHGEQKYRCDFCDKPFACQKLLVKHLKCHTGEQDYVCHLCGFTCKRASGLTSHHFRKHTDHKPTLCSHCGKSFRNPETLKCHLRLVNSVKEFKCSVCNKLFATQTLLTNHMIWHSDSKPFKCDQCGNAYKAKAHLNYHMRTHSGVRPFSCGSCSSSFSTSSLLNRHKKIHTGEKFLQCNICDKRFVDNVRLKRHLATHKSF